MKLDWSTMTTSERVMVLIVVAVVAASFFGALS
jgi:hypothetical protein